MVGIDYVTLKNPPPCRHEVVIAYDDGRPAACRDCGQRIPKKDFDELYDHSRSLGYML